MYGSFGIVLVAMTRTAVYGAGLVALVAGELNAPFLDLHGYALF